MFHHLPPRYLNMFIKEHDSLDLKAGGRMKDERLGARVLTAAVGWGPKLFFYLRPRFERYEMECPKRIESRQYDITIGSRENSKGGALQWVT